MALVGGERVKEKSFHGPLCAILLLVLIVWLSPFLLFVFAQAEREKQRFSSESLVQDNYRVKASSRGVSPPPLLSPPATSSPETTQQKLRATHALKLVQE